MNSPSKLCELDSLGVLRARGPDAVAFLQGQLSNDLTQLSATRALLAGYHNPQGRTIALLRLIENAPGDVLAILPRELIATVAARLTKFILRSKVKLADESAAWTIHGLTGADSTAATVALPAQVNEVARSGAALLVLAGAAPPRTLIVQPRESPAVLSGVPAAPESVWHAASIAAAEPQVFASTSEEFVAQMLNLDVLGAIDFAKGCYTGQEVIARAHYRGRVKRRLQRFVSHAPLVLRPGDTLELPDGRAVKVVDAAAHADGRCEFLGVTGLVAEDAAAAAPSAAVQVQSLPLPYALPD
ncbi:MAG TPA: hypothetical protein VGI91_06045 [Steroidobacteraceae bacterium]|jgi:hypothetical protein